MTIIEAINAIDSLKHNTYTQEDKVKWLSKVDWYVYCEMISTHEGRDDVEFHGYDNSTPMDTVLLIPAPYDETYLRYLEAQIDYMNGEYGKYNNSMTMFNESYAAYERQYNRTHMPIGKQYRFF